MGFADKFGDAFNRSDAPSQQDRQSVINTIKVALADSVIEYNRLIRMGAAELQKQHELEKDLRLMETVAKNEE